MKKKTQTSLRTRLRTNTRLAHEQLDQEVSRFDLTTPNGLIGFLDMQSAAFQTLLEFDASAKTEAMIRDLLERATLDLCELRSSAETVPAAIEPVHPLSIDYAVAGSRLGSRLLKKRWQAATDPKVRRARAYFSAPSYIDIWASFCDATEAMQSTGPQADQVVKDANRIFHMYHECARTLMLTKEATHV